jgi:hypothetical protein
MLSIRGGGVGRLLYTKVYAGSITILFKRHTLVYWMLSHRICKFSVSFQIGRVAALKLRPTTKVSGDGDGEGVCRPTKQQS